MELKTFECDCCGKEFKIPVSEVPADITLNDQRKANIIGGKYAVQQDGSLKEENEYPKHLCEDCYCLLDFICTDDKVRRKVEELVNKLVCEEGM